MPSAAHGLAVLALCDDPALLTPLLEKLAGIHLPVPLTREDASVRFTKAVEVRPDLLFRAPDGYSLAVEVQGDTHDEKGRRWGVLMAVLHDGSGVMGDLLIVTRSGATLDRWIARAVTAASVAEALAEAVDRSVRASERGVRVPRAGCRLPGRSCARLSRRRGTAERDRRRV